MDTWATSSLSPVIAALRWDDLQGPDQRPIAERIAASPLLPMQLRPQAHDIIRTWAFYTIARSLLHDGRIPWETVMISGHGLDPQGHSIHKSKGNSPIAPATLLDRYGADAVRYWACGGSTGADQPINTDVMRQGSRLMTKLWNAARLVAGRMEDEDGMFEGRAGLTLDPPATAVPIDRALLSWLQRLIVQASTSYRRYEYAAARDATERFFWGTFCDNYLELVKGRLYDEDTEIRQAAAAMLGHTLRVVLQLFAPMLPHITEEISSRLFARDETDSIHRSRWPEPDATLIDPEAERAGEAILAITTAVRRFKSARQLGQGTTLARLTIAAADPLLRTALAATTLDLRSVSRATEITFVERAAGLEEIAPGLWLGIEAGPDSNQAHRRPAG
jgi:valyl-tRNA synthetase